MRSLNLAMTAFFLLSLILLNKGLAQTQKRSTGEPHALQSQTDVQIKDTRSKARIKGRVINEGGRPVSDASIMVFPVNIAGNMQNAVTSLLRPVASDADGNFELSSLQPGAYTISASSPGYISSDKDSKEIYRPGDVVTVTLVKGAVITGRVTNSSGDPVVGALVRAIKVRDSDEKPARARGGVGAQISDSLAMLLGPYTTDDRGIYRIYGLEPGYYQVAAGGRGTQGFSLGGANPYDGDAPTYFPSSTIETAAEVTVAAGGEATNIDIRYRENRGHSIGGTISSGDGPAPQVISVLLTRASGIVEATTVIMAGRNNFGFDSLLDGDYVITAMGSSGNPAMAAGADGISASVSEPRRVTVKGADISGINLVIEPLASISGRAVFEQIQDPKVKQACKDIRSVPIEGTVLSAPDEAREQQVDPMNGPFGGLDEATPNAKGEFTISLLRAGTHRMELNLPADHLYAKKITLTQAGPNAKPIDAAKTGVRLKSGDRVKGLVIAIAEGAASLSGNVVEGVDNKPPETRMRVHLVPAEPEAGDEVLRYFEREVSVQGGFSMKNLAPGKYWLVVREAAAKPGEADLNLKPVAWDAAGRAALRFEGEASKKVIELTQCQRMSDYELKFVPLVKPSKPPAKTPR